MTSRPPIQAYAGDEYDEARANRYKKKAPAATGAINTETPRKRNESMNTSIPHPSDNFDALFVMSVGRNRVWVQPASLANGESIIELTDDLNSNLLMKPTEALAVAAALQAVATHVLEEESRFIRRRTEPGQPAFEEGI